MIKIENVNINLIVDDRLLIKDFNFVLNDNDKVAVIGEEGNGKSTLLKYLYDPMLIDKFCEYQGKVSKDKIIGYLPQFMEESELQCTIKEYFKGVNVKDYSLLLESLNIGSDLINENPTIGRLSGGEKIKIQLAKIISQKPDLLLLDEPTNDLDIKTLIWLENFIKKTRMPIMYVSHDETLIENTANIIVHLEQLKKKNEPKITITYEGYREYISKRSLLFARQLMIANKQRADYQRQNEKLQKIYNKVEYAQNTISRGNPSGAAALKRKIKNIKVQKNKMDKEKEEFVRIPEREMAIITQFDQGITIPNGKVIIEWNIPELCSPYKVLSTDIKLVVKGKKHIGIIGDNGNGKSTLLRLIWSTVQDRNDINPYYMPQNYEEVLDYEISPVEFLIKENCKEEITKVSTYMGNMKFTHKEMTNKIKNLSGGQKAKILFLDMVLKRCDVLLLDEPTRNFSPLSSPVIRDTLSLFEGTIISVSHDRKYLNEVCDEVYELSINGLTKVNYFV
ncbi:MAG: ATP-binding cassette domain-containing protein [Erysipelotrichaceae bacterium]